VCVSGSAFERSLADVVGPTVIPVTFARWFLPAFATSIANQVKSAQIVQGTGFLTNLVARRVGSRTGATVINTAHVMPGAARLDGASVLSSMVRVLLDKTSRHKVDRYVAVSEAVAQALVADGVDSSQIVVVPNGIDVARLTEAAQGPLPVELQAGMRVGFVGRLRPVKGCEVFLQAAKLISAQRADVNFVIAGSGTLGADLRVHSASMGLSGRVRFLGFVDPVAPVQKALDIVVIPSLSEAFGLSAIEALALQVPVVASRVGGLPEVIVDGETGLLVTPDDPQAIVDAVYRLLDDPELGRRMAAAGAQLVEECYTLERMVDGYLGVYRGIAS
jgi:glycosyltransferase involved in cell wall biosynthesis